MPILSAIDIGKAYKHYSRKSGRFLEWLGLEKRHHLKWVLKGVSFDVNPGESVGIVGINGAGKSTLLKIVAGTTTPTTGSVDIRGRVAALLELGMGFHPDFTGRENVCLAAQLQGIEIGDILGRMKGIEEFAEIGEYIDMPVRIYSSGMQMRLAFAVATEIRPDILIVDEALSVGDAAFQRKCFRRIEDFRSLGTTLLFVSHSTETVKKICDRAMFIKDGMIAAFDKASVVCDTYERYLFGGNGRGLLNQTVDAKDKVLAESISFFDSSLSSSCEVVYGEGSATIETVWLSSEAGANVNVIPGGSRFSVNYIVRFHSHVDEPVFAFMIKTMEGVAVYGTDSSCLETNNGRIETGRELQVSFTMINHLAPGVYYLNCGIRQDKGEKPLFLHRRVDTLIFRVSWSDTCTAGTGLADLEASIKIS